MLLGIFQYLLANCLLGVADLLCRLGDGSDEYEPICHI